MIRALIFALVPLSAAAPAWACKCRVIPYEEAVRGVDWAFRGTARDVVAASRDGVVQLRARVRVTSNIRGPRKTRWATVWTQGSTAACGYAFQEGRRVTFGLRREPDGRWSTNSCVMHSLNTAH